MSRLADWVLDLFYPTRCIVCRTRLSPGIPRLCKECRERIPHPERMKLPGITVCVSACRYEKELADAMRRFKFNGRQAYAVSFGELIAERIYEDLRDEYDVLSWVPLAKDRKRSRGYDQTQLLAESAAARLCQPLTATLKKRNGVSRQSGTKSAEERKANILGAYTVPDPLKVKGLRVLLVDDIVTTGATLSECAKTLRLAGAESVCCAVLARTPRQL